MGRRATSPSRIDRPRQSGRRTAAWLGPALLVPAVAVLPWLGAAGAGRSLAGLDEFPPPIGVPWDYVTFAWPAVAAVFASLAGLAAAWIHGARQRETPPRTHPADRAMAATTAPGRWPVWGSVAVVWTLAWWVVAWTRWPVSESVQRFTFFPLWLGFVVSVNACIHHRTGTCLMQRQPRRWLALFGVSAIFWWGFEWLNRFVLNWHYLGVDELGPLAYAVHATLSFSTVLPAVAAAAEWLDSHDRWRRITARGVAWRWLARRSTGLALLIGAGLALVFTGALPRWFYPALWVAPLAWWLGAEILHQTRGGRGDARASAGVAAEVARGDWRAAGTWMAAALGCGFVWEMWNSRSLAHWIYTVPGVERWHVFEMPLVGYAGYLPFGVLCLLVTRRFIPLDPPR